MANCGYSFKKEAKVYVVNMVDPLDSVTWLWYNIDISEITFGQTFTEYSYSNKTIQSPYMFEQSTINKANPANFELTFPAIREADFEILFDLALDYNSFALYIITQADAFEILGCVITNANFIIEKTRPLSMGISGEATKVNKLTFPPTLPGTLIPRSNTMTYNRVGTTSILLNNSLELGDYLASVTVELQNDINWIPYTTVNGALIATNAGSSMYPSGYTVEKRILAGTITQYLTDTNYANLLQWNTNIPIHISVGQEVGPTRYGFDINMANCSFTNRLGSETIFTQSYDWRMTHNPTNLSDIITYTTLP